MSKTKLNSRFEIQEFKLYLFGKDVLSIIEKYYLEGFDEWSQIIKNLNKEYQQSFICTERGVIYDYCNHVLFNWRDQWEYTNYTFVYNYNPKENKIRNTNIQLPKNYF